MERSSDHQGLDRYVTRFTGVCSANWDVTLPRLVLNQISRERVVRRGGGGLIVVDFREVFSEAQSVTAQKEIGDFFFFFFLFFFLISYIRCYGTRNRMER